MDVFELKTKVINGQAPKKTLSIVRVNICEKCEFMLKATRQCKVCWCFIDLKTKLVDSECPEHKW